MKSLLRKLFGEQKGEAATDKALLILVALIAALIGSYAGIYLRPYFESLLK